VYARINLANRTTSGSLDPTVGVRHSVSIGFTVQLLSKMLSSR
jgi:hypothetical protein